ncbi:MAG: hypothetical protein RSB23_04750 [Alistipes sp.]
MKKLINPFVYLAGEKTIIIGLIILILSALFSWQLGTTCRGIVSTGYAELPLWKCFVQQLIIWCVFGSLLYLAARLLSKSKIRAIDIYGNNLFARLPFLLLVLLSALPAVRSFTLAALTQTGAEMATMGISPAVLIFSVAALIALVWFFAWSYMGFAVAANLRGARAAGAFIGCYLLAEVLSAQLWKLFA